MNRSFAAGVFSAAAAAVMVLLAPVGAALAGAGGSCSFTVPEPSSLLLLAGGMTGFLYLHRRKSKRK